MKIFIVVSHIQLYAQPTWAYKTPNNQIIHYQDQGAEESNIQNNLFCFLFQALEIKFANPKISKANNHFSFSSSDQ